MNVCVMASPADWNGLELCADLALLGDLVAHAASKGSDEVGPSGACDVHGLLFVTTEPAPALALDCALPFCFACAFACCNCCC